MQLADLLPTTVRKVIYAILGTLYALELVFDVVPAGWESKIIATLTILGFGLAFVNVPSSNPEDSVE